MPRGRPKGYVNRTDLQAGKPLPVSAPTGMPYGDNKALRDSQKAVPMAGTKSPTPPKMAAPAPLPAAPQTPPTAMPTVPLTAPTQRPMESVTTGLANTTASSDMQNLKNTYLSYFEDALRYQNVPQQFSDFVTWLRTQ